VFVMAYPDEGVVKGWRVEWLKGKGDSTEDQYIARRAADWELEFCIEWLATITMTKPWDTVAQLALELRAARRPEPLSLKKLALRALHGRRQPTRGH